MLVLSRKCGEAIFISDSIQIKVISVSGNRVRLGFSAPDGIAVHRGEVHERIQRELLSLSHNATGESSPCVS